MLQETQVGSKGELRKLSEDCVEPRLDVATAGSAVTPGWTCRGVPSEPAESWWMEMYRIGYTFEMTAGILIRKRRRELGLTQGQLAEMAATSRQRITTYELDQVSPQADR
jgi:DNA-binding XRE family transcriptional regulator